MWLLLETPQFTLSTIAAGDEQHVNAMAPKKLLEQTDWLRELPTSAKARVHDDAYELFFRPGEVVVRKGDPAKAWLGVAEGLLKVSTVHRSGKVVMFSGLLEGCWAGEGTVFNRELFRYDVYAMRESRVICLPSATFRWCEDDCGWITGNSKLLAALALFSREIL